MYTLTVPVYVSTGYDTSHEIEFISIDGFILEILDIRKTDSTDSDLPNFILICEDESETKLQTLVDAVLIQLSLWSIKKGFGFYTHLKPTSKSMIFSINCRYIGIYHNFNKKNIQFGSSYFSRTKVIDDILITALKSSNFSPDPKLVSAMGLYRDHFSEDSNPSKFSILSTCLELLKGSVLRSQPELDIISKWEDAIEKEKNNLGPDSLNSLTGSLSYLKHVSISTVIRNSFKDACIFFGESEIITKQYMKRASKIYKIRSNFFHEGEIPSAGDVSEIRALVSYLLNYRTKLILEVG